MRDMSLANTSSYQEMLDEVNEALARIEDGRYGICELSGKPIPEKRLRAVPWTRYTLESEEQLEREGKAPFQFQLPQSQRLKGSSETIILHSHDVHEETSEEPGGPTERA
ncbi:MAG: TraR/DksA family transcriptional regulator [Verrucomicrobia bacterium]|nr:TraR/DksA family transcriptional regulator [Verrucomicrobiota bacterium]